MSDEHSNPQMETGNAEPPRFLGKKVSAARMKGELSGAADPSEALDDVDEL